MFLNNARAVRRATRLGVETLEGRTLLSASGLVSQAVSSTVVYATHWSVTPGAVLTGSNAATGNHKSTGSVDVALFRDASLAGKLGAAPATIHVGLVTTTSSATDSRPDIYHTSFTLTLRLKDAASGVIDTLSFKGTIDGTLTASHSMLTINFKTPVQKVTLGHHVYTITLPQGIHPPAPGTTHATLDVKIGVANK